MRLFRILKSPYSRLFLNFLYALGNCTVGYLAHSWWFITIGAYYAVLTTTRFSVLMIKQRAKGDYLKEGITKRITGVLLVVLSFCLVGVNILSAVKDRGKHYHEIIMIAMAAYAFTKITIAIIGMVRARRDVSPTVQTLRNISFADAVVSIYTLQRSMLVSFPGLEPNEILIFNILTGTAAYATVLFLGINLIGGKHINMAKSKLVQTGEKITETITGGYKKMESGIVAGYKTIEKGVVDSYRKVEDKFVATYLTKEGETVEAAKERLKQTEK